VTIKSPLVETVSLWMVILSDEPILKISIFDRAIQKSIAPTS